MRATYLRPGAYLVTIKATHARIVVLAAHPCEALCRALAWLPGEVRP